MAVKASRKGAVANIVVGFFVEIHGGKQEIGFKKEKAMLLLISSIRLYGDDDRKRL